MLPNAALAQHFNGLLPSDALAHYPFENSGNNSLSERFPSQPSGRFEYTPNGKGGNTLHLSGDSSIYYTDGGHVILSDFSNELTNGFSVSLWGRHEQIGGNPFNEEAYISFGAFNGNVAEILLNYRTRKLEFAVIGDPPTYSEGRIQVPIDSQSYPSSWKHLVMTYQPGSFSAYVNGRLVGNTNVTVNIFPVTEAAIGRHWWDNGQSSSARLTADIDEVRIYKRALSEKEVSAIYYFDNVITPSVEVEITSVNLISRVNIGNLYQIVSATSLGNWTNLGPPFTATSQLQTNHVNVSTGTQYFRIIELIAP